MLSIILILWNLPGLVLWPQMWSALFNFPSVLKRKLCSAFIVKYFIIISHVKLFHNVLCPWWFLYPYWFCLPLSITDREWLKYPAIYFNCIYVCHFFFFCFMYFEAVIRPVLVSYLLLCNQLPILIVSIKAKEERC